MSKTEDRLRGEVVFQYHEDIGLWDWETDDSCCWQLGFSTREEAEADFEEFVQESRIERGEWV
ncbi:MAG: hypothetical protein F6K65_33100 [Moorea sp. SIO3C2]|nr:hypothetical protein [Moorena sp. SIO3C2]